MKKHLKYILLALAIIVALGITFYKNLDYSYKMQGEAVNILESAYAGAVGYDVVEGQYEAGTTTFTGTAGDSTGSLRRCIAHPATARSCVV